MTQKRFIKLLMSRGIERNRAREIARLYNMSNTSYKSAYADFLVKTKLKNATANLGAALGKASQAIGEMLKVWGNFVKQFMKGQEVND